jgi:hypothetical protein
MGRDVTDYVDSLHLAIAQLKVRIVELEKDVMKITTCEPLPKKEDVPATVGIVEQETVKPKRRRKKKVADSQ